VFPGEKAGTNGRGEWWGKWVEGWMRCKNCTHVSKCKNYICWDDSRNRGREVWRRMVEEVNSCMLYLIHCKTCVNAAMYTHPSQQ
jgi:hypothetical protein